MESKVDMLISYIRNKDQPILVKNFNLTNFKKLQTIEDLNEFEDSLKDINYKDSLINHAMSKYQHTSDKVENRKIAYYIVDTFTDRSLFKRFSLNGKTRNGKKNLALRERVGYIQFIFECSTKLSPMFKHEWLIDTLDTLCRNKYTSSKKKD